MTEQKPILIFAEDDVGIAKLLKRVFEKGGYDVRLHSNGHGALEELKALGRPAVLLTDLGLEPHEGKFMNGIDLINESRKLHPDMPAILFTGSHAVSTKEQADALGVKLIIKPAMPPEMLDAIAEAQKQLDAPKGPRGPMDHATRPASGQKGLFD